MPQIIPNLWFDTEALYAAEVYCSVFPGSSIDVVSHYPDDTIREAGMVLTVDFTLDGQRFTAINGGPQFPFTEAVSLLVDCADQAEIDHYWAALSAGGREGQCGWLTDRYGVSWQICPADMAGLMSGDRARTARVFAAMMPMRKLDLATLRGAADG
ncbi:MAG: VOC family protein [Miltoncostaeaceae bacterium]